LNIFYGFIGGDTSQWAPAIFENIKPIEPPHDDKNYFFEKDMADKAIERICLLHSIAPDKPWVTYFAPGTAHAPHAPSAALTAVCDPKIMDYGTIIAPLFRDQLVRCDRADLRGRQRVLPQSQTRWKRP
jgi:hypothetical protein